MNLSKIKTPGVYITETDSFPNTVIPVPTAIPAFIGYTPQAIYEGKSYSNVPQRITSLAEFEAIYGIQASAEEEAQPLQYNPQYYLIQKESQSESGEYIHLNGNYYAIVPDPNTIYYLYNSIRLFYMNGGGDAYIVSVGSYGSPAGQPMKTGAQLINPNVHLSDLITGVDLLKNEAAVTLYICPDATLLSVEENGRLMQKMLSQNAAMQTAMSIFDLIGARHPDPIHFGNDIDIFRENTGSVGLEFGAAYYPFVGTNLTSSTAINFTNLFNGDIKPLEAIINPADQFEKSIATIFANYENGTLSPAEVHKSLTEASSAYALIMKHLLAEINLLPPSGGIAGVMATIDNQTGVWKAPANTSIDGVVSLPIKITDNQQANMNVDAVTGKSVNAIRYFNGIGILIWGARTLDGNSQDWRYIPIRRTLTMIEQSCKQACHMYVFSSNDATTWKNVTAMLSSFLTDLWKQGCLQGAKPSDAFKVSCGLGSTMTAQDIMDGYMRVSICVAVTHPADFIVLEFEQEMAKSA